MTSLPPSLKLSEQTVLALLPTVPQPFATLGGFEVSRHIAEYMARSKGVRDCYREDPGTIVLAIDLASISGLSLFTILTGVDIQGGKIFWTEKPLRALFRDRLLQTVYSSAPDYEFDGESGSDAFKCRVVVNRVDGKPVDAPWTSIGMARKFGCLDEVDSYWHIDPKRMLAIKAFRAFMTEKHGDLLGGSAGGSEDWDFMPAPSPTTPTGSAVLHASLAVQNRDPVASPETPAASAGGVEAPRDPVQPDLLGGGGAESSVPPQGSSSVVVQLQPGRQSKGKTIKMAQGHKPTEPPAPITAGSFGTPDFQPKPPRF